MWKERLQHLKALDHHFIQFCGPWVTHKNDIPIHVGQVLKSNKNNITNIFYHFLFTVSLGNWALKMFEKFRLYRKLVCGT